MRVESDSFVRKQTSVESTWERDEWTRSRDKNQGEHSKWRWRIKRQKKNNFCVDFFLCAPPRLECLPPRKLSGIQTRWADNTHQVLYVFRLRKHPVSLLISRSIRSFIGDTHTENGSDTNESSSSLVQHRGAACIQIQQFTTIALESFLDVCCCCRGTQHHSHTSSEGCGNFKQCGCL